MPVDLSTPQVGQAGAVSYHFRSAFTVKAHGLCESRGGRPGLPVPNSPYGLCGRKATLNSTITTRVLELCESRGGRPGLSVLNSSYGLCGLNATLDSNSTTRAQELCGSRGGRPGLPSLISLRFLWT